MKKRSCRRTGFEQEQHDRAIRVRKMTDAQLCAYLDELMRAAKSCGEVCGICGKHHKKRTNKP